MEFGSEDRGSFSGHDAIAWDPTCGEAESTERLDIKRALPTAGTDSESIERLCFSRRGLVVQKAPHDLTVSEHWQSYRGPQTSPILVSPPAASSKPEIMMGEAPIMITWWQPTRRHQHSLIGPRPYFCSLSSSPHDVFPTSGFCSVIQTESGIRCAIEIVESSSRTLSKGAVVTASALLRGATFSRSAK